MAGTPRLRKLSLHEGARCLQQSLHVVILPRAYFWARRGKRVLGGGSRWRDIRRQDIRRQGIRWWGTRWQGIRWLLVVAGRLGWDPVQIPIADTTAQTALSTPGCVGSYSHLPAGVGLGVVNHQLQGLPLVGLDECKEVLGLLEDLV